MKSGSVNRVIHGKGRKTPGLVAVERDANELMGDIEMVN